MRRALKKKKKKVYSLKKSNPEKKPKKEAGLMQTPPRELWGILNRRVALEHHPGPHRHQCPPLGWVQGADRSLETRDSQDGFPAPIPSPVLGLCPLQQAQGSLLRNPCLPLVPVQLFPKMPQVFLLPEWSVPAAHPILFHNSA